MRTIAMHKEDTVNKSEDKFTYLVIFFAVCFLSNVIGGTVSTLMSVYLPVAVKDLLGDQDGDQLNYISGYISAFFIFGWAFGGFCWGLIGDRIGRKKSLLLAIASYGVFTVLTGQMTTWWGVMICRFCSGFGVGGVLVVSFTYFSEVWPQKTKAIAIGVLSIGIPVGIFSAGLINYMVASWRKGFMIGFVPLLISIVCFLLLQESQIWKKHKKNKVLDKKESSLFSKEYGRTLFRGSVIFGTMLIGLWAIFSWLPTWIQGLVTNSDGQKERGLSMMFLGAGGLTGGILSGWLVNLIGLRKSMLLCFGVCASLSFILFKTNQSFSAVIYPEIAVLALFFGASQGVLSVYVPQLFPTGIRAAATGFCFNIGRIFTATAVLFVGVLVTVLGGFANALFIFSMVFLVGFVTVWLLNDASNGKV